MKNKIILCTAALGLLFSCDGDDARQLSYEDIYGYPYAPVTNEPANGAFFLEKSKNLTFTESGRTEETASYTIQTTGSGASFTTERIEGVLNSRQCVLTLRYKTDKKIQPVISLDISRASASAKIGEWLPASDWTEYAWDLGSTDGLIATTGWGNPGSYFRMTLEPEGAAGANIELKDIRFRERTAEETAFAERGQWVKPTEADGGGFSEIVDITQEEGGFNLINRNVYKIALTMGTNNWINSLPFPRAFRNGEQLRLRFEYKCDRSVALLLRMRDPDWGLMGPHVINPIPATPGDEWQTIDADLSPTFGGIDQSRFSEKPIHMVFYYEPDAPHDLYIRGMHFYSPEN